MLGHLTPLHAEVYFKSVNAMHHMLTADVLRSRLKPGGFIQALSDLHANDGDAIGEFVRDRPLALLVRRSDGRIIDGPLRVNNRSWRTLRAIAATARQSCMKLWRLRRNGYKSAGCSATSRRSGKDPRPS